MNTLNEKKPQLHLCGSNYNNDNNAVKIDSRRDINYDDTLSLYCANNDIVLTDKAFYQFSFKIKNYRNVAKITSYFFWITIK